MLNIKTMSVKLWYKHLLEVQMTHTEPEDPSALVPCRVERRAPSIDWGRSWLAVCVPGLTPEMRYFLWKMLQCIISTQDRLHRMNKPIASSPLCVQCTAGEVDDIEHALLRCSKIKPGADFLLETLKSEIPDFTLECIKYLDFRSEDLLIPTYLTARDIVATLEFQILHKELLLAICSCKCGTEHFDAEKLTLAASKLHCMWNV